LPAAGRKSLSRSLEIEHAEFTENTAPLLIYDATASIRHARFHYNGTGDDATDESWDCCAGAITAVGSRVVVQDSEFIGNRSQGFGGAVNALGTRLTLQRSLFSHNRARVGGAVFSWAHAIGHEAWSDTVGDHLSPALALHRVRFLENEADIGGGAIAWAGPVSGDSATFARNVAESGGALAHWQSFSLPPDFAQAAKDLVAMTAAAPQSLTLARGVFVDNIAQQQGAAIGAGPARVALGNALVARNRLRTTSAMGAAIEAQEFDVANGTVIDNVSGGLRLLAGGGKASIQNTVLLRNGTYGCQLPGSQLVTATGSVQFPSADCAGVPVADPQIDDTYRPVLDGLASHAGNLAICISASLVAGLDLNSVSRGTRGTCAAGAYEPDPRLDPVTGWSGETGHWLRYIAFWLILLALFAGILFFYMRKRRHTAPCRRRL